MTIHNKDPIKESWLELLQEEAESRGVQVNFPFQLWDFNFDERNFVAGKIHKAERENYEPPNEDRIFFGARDEVDEKDRFHGKTVSVVLDIYSSGESFVPSTDQFIFVDSELRTKLPSENRKPSIHIESNRKEYYCYVPTGSNNKMNIPSNNWDILFDMVER